MGAGDLRPRVAPEQAWTLAETTFKSWVPSFRFRSGRTHSFVRPGSSPLVSSLLASSPLWFYVVHWPYWSGLDDDAARPNDLTAPGLMFERLVAASYFLRWSDEVVSPR